MVNGLPFFCINENHLLCRWSKKLLAWYSNKKPPNVKDKKGFPTNLIKTLGGLSMKDKNSLAHTTWNCKYHIVFAQNIEDKQSMENIK